MSPLPYRLPSILPYVITPPLLLSLLEIPLLRIGIERLEHSGLIASVTKELRPIDNN
jgi:hypothetical protein